ncbi:hypothetical protein PsYK624_012910 [Phanerochaete sordida]|uniref:Protein HRI1 n=1 Tax=Phanerochaete sordida TaxID=48140 RepID=A0A9P3L8P3_9APHY|nr:hypothetical protein PsYK624_012910 [Phanerochaete sordida]
MAASEDTRRPPAVSRRISMRFLPNEPDERTSTLVLNAGGATSLFTDFRPFLDDPARCEWAFAGQKEYLPDGRCAFNHLLDSRVPEGAQPPPDVGTWHVLANGDELETGEMLNPATGATEPYEEVWREEDVVPGTKVVALQLVDVHPDGSPGPVRGVFVQVGDWAQGVVRTPHGVSARRRHYVDSWRTVAAHGPDAAVMLPLDGGVEHDTATYVPTVHDADVQWTVVENYTWNP